MSTELAKLAHAVSNKTVFALVLGYMEPTYIISITTGIYKECFKSNGQMTLDEVDKMLRQQCLDMDDVIYMDAGEHKSSTYLRGLGWNIVSISINYGWFREVKLKE